MYGLKNFIYDSHRLSPSDHISHIQYSCKTDKTPTIADIEELLESIKDTFPLKGKNLKPTRILYFFDNHSNFGGHTTGYKVRVLLDTAILKEYGIYKDKTVLRQLNSQIRPVFEPINSYQQKRKLFIVDWVANKVRFVPKAKQFIEG